MSATIFYEVEGGLPLETARPDALWCELVRVLVSEKSKETGDGDPYGAGGIELKPEHARQLWLISNSGWPEVADLAKAVGNGNTVWVHREP